MKLFLLLFLLFVINVFSQEASQGQNVELPDFVITGKETFTMPEMKKIKPDHISTLSEQFIKPVYSPEELEIKEFSDPLKKDVILLDEVEFTTGKISFGISNNYLPSAGIKYYLPFQNAFLATDISTISRRPYIEHADLFALSGSMKFDYFIDEKAGFLPGVNLYGTAKMDHSGRKFFASLTPDLKRNISDANLSFGLKNISGRNFIYDFTFNNDYLNLGNEGLTDNILGFNAHANLFFKNFELISGFQFNSQYLNHPNLLINNVSYNYYKFRGLIGLKSSQTFKVNLGFEYSASDTNKAFSPVISLVFKLDRGIVFFGEYSPTSEFITNKSLLRQNPYFDALTFKNLFMKKNANFSLGVKYEYQKQFEINGGFTYFSSPYFPYFSDTLKQGVFEINAAEAKSFNTFLNLLFHPGRFGYFYAEINAGETKDTAGLLVPYSYTLKGEAVYGYNFDFGISSRIRLLYLSKTYTDRANKIEQAPVIDLGIKFEYMLSRDFNITLEFNNLLNRKNYLFRNYDEKPLDIMVGFKYIW